MRYDVRVKKDDGSEGHFELERDEELKVDEFVRVGTMVYKVRTIVPLGLDESDEFDAVVEADWAAGPAQAGFRDS